MAFDNHRNFAWSHVATAPSPADTGTSLVVTAAEGTLFPAAPFNAVVWPKDQMPTSSNAEVVRVTNIVTDTLTITRTQEGSSARTIVAGDQIAASVTAKTLTDVESGPASGDLGGNYPSPTLSIYTATKATIQASTPTGKRIAFCSDTFELGIWDGSAWRFFPFAGTLDPSAPDMGYVQSLANAGSGSYGSARENGEANTGTRSGSRSKGGVRRG